MQTLVFSFTLLLVLGAVQTTMAQFIRLNIVIPPESSIMDLSDMPADLPPAESNADMISTKSTYRWLELRSVENLEMLVLFQKDRTTFGTNNDRLLYLNDGSTLFSSARPFKEYAQTFFLLGMRGKAYLNAESLNSFSAWVGIPAQASGKLTIIYP